jgi:histidyl-tRNA synthetase
MTTERVKILGDLWKAGISAETLYADNPKPQKQIEYAFDNGIPLVLWIGEDEIAKGVVKIKSLSFHEEVFVERKDLVEKVKE